MQQHFYMYEFLLLLFLVFYFAFFYCCIASWRDLAAAIKVQNSIQLDQQEKESVRREGTERGRGGKEKDKCWLKSWRANETKEMQLRDEQSKD